MCQEDALNANSIKLIKATEVIIFKIKFDILFLKFNNNNLIYNLTDKKIKIIM